jgi:uncharacterized protein YkwD
MKSARLVLAVLLAGGGLPAGTGAGEDPNGDVAEPFTDYTAEAFLDLEATREKIDPNQVDRGLLDAAVFHETNRRRHRHGLPALAFDGRAREAARMQSAAMAKHGFIGHRNPFDAELRTPMDRAQRAGLQPRFLAENLADAFVRQHPDDGKVHVRVEDGQKVASARAEGPPIPVHTYRGFAQAVLDDWMGSPGHRQNILHRSPEYLGTACSPASRQEPMEKFSCTQVFFAPLGPS